MVTSQAGRQDSGFGALGSETLGLSHSDLSLKVACSDLLGVDLVLSVEDSV